MVFRAGLNWGVIEKKWPDIKRAMADFSIDAVARFDAGDIDRLLKADGMIRSAKKREASSVMFLFAVGQEMPQTLEKMHGSAQ